MNDIERFKEEYLREVRKLLSEYPAELKNVEDLWEAGEYRPAYLMVDRVVRKFRLVRTEDCDKADANFFWGVIN